MYDFLKAGDEVIFPGLLDIKLIVDEVYESRGAIRCKYYDDQLKKFIKIMLPADAVVRTRARTAIPSDSGQA
jgi:hypothetical protein